MSQIQVKCVDQVLKIVKAPVIASGGLNEVCVVFDFCEKWDGFMKTALFYRDAETVYYAVLDDNDMCVVPWEVYHEAGYFYFSVFGEKGSARRTSNKVRYKIVGGAITEELIPPDPTPGVYDQIVALVNEMKEGQVAFLEEGENVLIAADSATADAASAAEDAIRATTNANNAAALANSAKTAAEKAAEDANAATAEAVEATEAAQQATAAAATATEETIAARDAFLETASESIEIITELLGTADEGPAIVCEESGSNITLNDSANRLVQGLNLYGKTTQNGTPTPDAPAELVTAGAGGSIGVAVTGKNLFGGEALSDVLVAKVGATKSETAGTVQYSASSVIGKQIFKAPDRNKQYTIILYGKNTTNTTTRTNLSWYYSDKTSDVFNFKTAGELSYCVATSKAGKQVVGLYGYNSSSSTILYYDKCGIFEGVVTADDFEAYNGQTLTATTPNGLPGIAVSSGGNYTDENGQQWICDEIDFARGVYVKRCAKANLGTLSWKVASNADVFFTGDLQAYIKVAAVMCDRYVYKGTTTSNQNAYGKGNFSISILSSDKRVYLRDDSFGMDATALKSALTGVMLLYARATPTETALTAEELAAYAAMHTNKPNTTVYNDAGAGMKLQYVADTKAYIDNKFNELATALVNNT